MTLVIDLKAMPSMSTEGICKFDALSEDILFGLLLNKHNAYEEVEMRKCENVKCDHCDESQ